MSARTAKMERKTRETQISVELNVDGTGKYDVDCDNQFLKHMIETLSRYSDMDITMKAAGDNDHHLIEDVGITLGKAFAKALDDKPIERMATSTVVMDDAMMMTSLDIVVRPTLSRLVLVQASRRSAVSFTVIVTIIRAPYSLTLLIHVLSPSVSGLKSAVVISRFFGRSCDFFLNLQH